MQCEIKDRALARVATLKEKDITMATNTTGRLVACLVIATLVFQETTVAFNLERQILMLRSRPIPINCSLQIRCAVDERRSSIHSEYSSEKFGDSIDWKQHRGLTRRETLSRSSYVAFSSIFIPATAQTVLGIKPSHASGGATAGGVYLLSAKQRYNRRVTAGITRFLSLSSSLENGDLDQTTSFFADISEGGWNDLSTAGYLLANAFRRSSNTPPDSLPSVKKWKSFQASVDATAKATKKQQTREVLDAYRKAEKALDAYLEAVQLPSVLEIKN